MRPVPGEPAPDFRGVTTDGSEVGLADFRGSKLVLYFYPMDFTPGCTAQACSLRDHSAEIRARGAQILGVSTQDAASHKRFAGAHRLNFPLLADRDRTVTRAYGAIVAALSRLHALLDPDQRERLAYLVRTGIVQL